MGSAQRICYNRWRSHLLGTTWLNRHRSIGKALACPSRGTIGSGQLFVRTLPHNTERRSPTDKVTGRHLLFAVITYRIQADRFGDLDRATKQVLDRTVAKEAGPALSTRLRRKRIFVMQATEDRFREDECIPPPSDGGFWLRDDLPNFNAFVDGIV